MPSLSKRLNWLQAPIGGFGFLVWMGAFQAYPWLRDSAYCNLADGVSGYILGFGSTFAGWVAVHLYKGNYDRFVDEHTGWKWFSILALVFIALFGAAGFVASVFGDTNWQFNIGFATGTFVMGKCLGPLVDFADDL